MGEDKIQKRFVEALNRYEKQEEVRKSRFFLENDSKRILEWSQSNKPNKQNVY